jgi:hypothetical protein
LSVDLSKVVECPEGKEASWKISQGKGILQALKEKYIDSSEGNEIAII